MKKYILSVILSLMVSGLSTATVRYEVIGLGLGMARSVNNKGQVVGNLEFRAFLWENGQMQDLGEGDAYSINNLGQIVGWGENDEVYMWENGNCTNLLFPGYSDMAFDINDSGQIVGRTIINDDQHAVLYQDGAIASYSEPACDYYSINNQGVIVGDQVVRDGTSRIRGYVIQENGMKTELVVPYYSELLNVTPYCINDVGQIAGYFSTGYTGGTQACMWNSDGSYVSLGYMGMGGGSIANSINNVGQIVGTAATHGAHGIWEAFVWEDGVMTNLNTLIPEDSGWLLKEAYGINDLGWIVGMGEGPDNNMAFVLRPVPEPMTVMLLGVGAVAAFRRK